MNGIEKDLKDRARVLRLNLLNRVGRTLAARYGVSAVPTTLVFDSRGEVRHRQEGLPNRKQIVARVMSQSDHT